MANIGTARTVSHSSSSQVIAELKGKDVKTVIAEGNKKLASIPSGGAAPAAAGMWLL